MGAGAVCSTAPCVLELRFGSCCRLWALPTLYFGSEASVLGSFWEYSLLSLISKYLLKPAHLFSALLFSSVISGCPDWGLESVLWCCVQLIHISHCRKILKIHLSWWGEGNTEPAKPENSSINAMNAITRDEQTWGGESSWLLMENLPWIIAEDINEEKHLSTKGCCRMPSNGPA